MTPFCWRGSKAYLGDIDLGTGNNGASQGGTEQVDVLVDGVASNGGEAKLLDELAADVNNLALESTNLHGLLAGSLEVLCEWLLDRCWMICRRKLNLPSWPTSATIFILVLDLD